MNQQLRTGIALAALSAAAWGQGRELPPAGGAPKPFTVPARQSFTLKNGMKVSLVDYGSTPVVALSARVGFGNANESAEEVWMADLLCALMKEGAGARNGVQLAQEAARMGGQLSVGAGVDESMASIQVLSEFAPDAVKLLADVLRRPALPGSELERLRADMLRRLAVQKAQPDAIADEAFAKALYGNHPYGRFFPDEARLKAYSMEQVKRFYKENVGAKRTHLYVVGRYPAGLKQAITAAFDGWEAGPEVVRNVPKTAAKKQLVLLDRPGAEQSTLRVGLPVAAVPGNADYMPMLVTDSILGGSFGSRITSNIREDKGYTYSPYSTVRTRYHTASWAESADVTTKVTGDSLKEIFSEIAKMRKEPPADQELQGIKNLMSGEFVLRNTSLLGIIGQLARVDLQGLGDAYLNSYVQKVNAVTRSDVQRVAETYLDPGKMTVVVVGDKAAIDSSLAPYK
ncbi:MAG: insulinase family protein [Acidobacteria bacterium]|nr:insulinase family protein [Acidobacteriota bacterium]